MWNRVELKNIAKLNVKAFYWKSVLVAFIMSLILSGGGKSNGRDHSHQDGDFVRNYFSNLFEGKWFVLFLGLAVGAIIIIGIIGILVGIFLINPLEVSCKKYFLDASLGHADLANLGYGYKSNYGNIVVNIFLRNLFIGLWGLLFVIPGIVKAYEYRMIPYLLSENPNLSFNDAKARSSEMMYGEKWNTFVLDLSFLLWHILSTITFGLVGLFWVGPYQAFTNVELFKALSVKTSGNSNAGDPSNFTQF